MKRIQLEELYNKFIEKVEQSRFYDGRGTYDVYECETCGVSVITTYRDYGVTPFAMPCTFCVDGTMRHVKTLDSVPNNQVVLEWVRPTLDQFLQLPKHSQHHVIEGGLLLSSDLEEYELLSESKISKLVMRGAADLLLQTEKKSDEKATSVECKRKVQKRRKRNKMKPKRARKH